MKKFLFPILLLFLAACDITGSSSNNPTFWATDTTKSLYDSSAWYQVDATKVGEGEHCIVYLENGNDVNSSTINTFIDEFDTEIWDTVTTNFASPTDIDNNAKVILLLLDIKDDYDGVNNQSYVGGFFFNFDLLTNDEISGFGYPSFIKSNEAELLYIDINPSDPNDIDTRSTIAHEFQHLVNFSQNVIAENGNPFPTWIDEGFAMAAESIFQDVDILESRELWYHYDPLHSGGYGQSDVSVYDPYSIAYGYPLVSWNPFQNGTAVLNDYALSHLFFAWLRIHKLDEGDSDTFFKDIMADTDNTFQAVLNECGDLGDGTEINSSDKMLKTFYMANIFGAKTYDDDGNITDNGNEEGLTSYLGKNQHSGPYAYPGSDSKINLYPGGAVYLSGSAFNDWDPVSDGGGNESDSIVYAIGNTSTYTTNYTSPYGTEGSNDVMIFINGDTDQEGDATESATRPSTVLINQSIRSSVSTDKTSSVITRSGVSDTPPKGAFRRGPENERLTIPGK